MNLSREEVQQILDALREYVPHYIRSTQPAITLLQSRLAEGEQEPIGRLVVDKYGDAGIGIEFTIYTPEEVLSVGQLVYAAP